MKVALPQTFQNNRSALELIVTAVEKAGYKLGTDFGLALDVAATEFYKDGSYHFEGKETHSR